MVNMLVLINEYRILNKRKMKNTTLSEQLKESDRKSYNNRQH